MLMKTTKPFWLILFFIYGGLMDNSLAQSHDEAGRALATKVMDALGGLQNWESTPAIAFDFVVESEGQEVTRRSHVWKRATSGYTVSWKDGKDGKAYRLEFSDIYQKKGQAWIDEQTPPDSTRLQLLERGYGVFINDTYWMIMPFKLLDPGVKLQELPAENKNGVDYRVLHVSFENVGLTPGDQYWLYIDPNNYRIHSWRYKLESGRESGHLWEDYQQFGQVMISRRRVAEDGKRVIRFDRVSVNSEK
jgi:hypothetical protein